MLLGWVLPGLMSVAIFGAWLGRAWIKRLVEKTVDHEFEVKIEKVRSDLRLSESRMAALQATVLSNRSGRRVIVDKRRLEALENIWRSALKLSPFQMALGSISMLKLDAVEERAARDPKMTEVVAALINSATIDARAIIDGLAAQEERPFLPADVWTTYSAYQAVLVYAFMRLDVIAKGIENSGELFSQDGVLKVAKASLPQFSDYIDKYGTASLTFVGEQLRELLVKQIQSALDGHEIDQADIDRSAQVIKLIGDMQLKQVVEEFLRIE